MRQNVLILESKAPRSGAVYVFCTLKTDDRIDFQAQRSESNVAMCTCKHRKIAGFRCLPFSEHRRMITPSGSWFSRAHMHVHTISFSLHALA